MIDNHIHLGQFFEKYYSAQDVFSAIKNVGVKQICFSSTTSCKTYTSTLATEILQEITEALSVAKNIGLDAHAFYWVIPQLHFDGATITQAMEKLPYKGIKIHPRAHLWDLNDKQTIKLLDEIFCYCKKNNLPILLHTGEDKNIDDPTRFLAFFEKYPTVTVILAHCRPIETVINILKKFPNYRGDTAFIDEDSLKKLEKENLLNQINFGSDFPITHFLATKYSDISVSLEEQYKKDIKSLM